MTNGWEYAGTVGNYWVYRKVENNRGCWKAQKVLSGMYDTSDFDPEKAIDITKAQADGFEPIENTLSAILGRKLLPR